MADRKHFINTRKSRFREFLRGAGWTDRSYHNDTCGRMELPLTDEPDRDFVVVWLEHQDPTQREDQDAKRYVVQVGITDTDL